MVGALAFHEASYKVNEGIGMGVKSPTADVLQGQEGKLRLQSTVSLLMLPPRRAETEVSLRAAGSLGPGRRGSALLGPRHHPRGKRAFLALVPPAGFLSSSKMLANNPPC